MFTRKNLESHLEKDCPNRDYLCEYCGIPGTYVDITTLHDATCEKKLISCPNTECSSTIQRQKIKEHVANECEYTMIPCKYSIFGCDVKKIRREMIAHEEDDRFHLKMAVDAMLE